MGKHIICLVLVVIIFSTLSSTIHGATWVSGSDAVNQAGIYGSQNVPASGNTPGARAASVSWKDASGDLWLMGGWGRDATGTEGFLNDLWRLNESGWAWVKGSEAVNQYGVYGTKGVGMSGNVPGGRNASVCWKTGPGSVWLFGGNGYGASGGTGALNDLWRFDGYYWAWMGGSQTVNQYGVYGTRGVAAAGNMPGGRRYGISWADRFGNLWLFGGYGYAASGSMGHLNDLWKFDGTNWTWVSGSDAVDQYGVYGTKGAAASGNTPGTRVRSISWIDASGNLWLLGGVGYPATGSSGVMNDLWKYDPSSGLWTWVSGDNVALQYGVYGTRGVAAASNKPGARYSSVSWIDTYGNLWLFGGVGYDTSATQGYLNDLWKFDGVNWTWVGGSDSVNQYGVYGAIGVGAGGNLPGSRRESTSWIDDSGNLMLFGGIGYAASSGPGNLNDLWKFNMHERAADLSGDGIVNRADLWILTDQWLTAPAGPPSADIEPYPSSDGIVNFRDFASLAGRWKTIDNGMSWVRINDPGISGHEGFNGYMSRYEVTNAQYCQYLNGALAAGQLAFYGDVVYPAGDTGHMQPLFEPVAADPCSQIIYSSGRFRLVNEYFPSNRADHPVVLVSWYGAKAFCDYYGYRLPTEWEWQAVADYDGSYTYGCGTTIGRGMANYFDGVTWGYANPLSLGTFPYTSPVDYYRSYGYGLNDMAGNVMEWTSSPLVGTDPVWYGFRGGGWHYLDDDYAVSYQNYCPGYFMDLDRGFRPCK
jgi:N-acetylneuraminic acid mutarotase